MKTYFFNLLITLILYPTIGFTEKATDTTLIKNHLFAVTKTKNYRNYQNIDQLISTAAYIKNVFDQYSNDVKYQEYEVNNQIYKNVICSFGPKEQPRIIVGAHYDVCGNQEGADDNASGVVGLLELARLLKNLKLNYRIDLVAYTLEEPPFFKTEYMGSYVHAKSLRDEKVEVSGMISVEMIGYFSIEKKSQSYPIGILSLFYGNKGDFITLVKKFGSGKFANKFGRRFRSTKTICTKTFKAPKSIPGIDYSDHLNYWHFGYSALMITDTSFYRNPHYHKLSDTMETLDLHRMALVIDGVYQALLSID